MKKLILAIFLTSFVSCLAADVMPTLNEGSTIRINPVEDNSKINYSEVKSQKKMRGIQNGLEQTKAPRVEVDRKELERQYYLNQMTQQSNALIPQF